MLPEPFSLAPNHKEFGVKSSIDRLSQNFKIVWLSFEKNKVQDFLDFKFV